MKKKEITDLRSKKIEDLRKMADVKRAEVLKTKMKIMGGKEKNLSLKRNLSRDLAKILTLVREKEIIESLEKKEEVKEDKGKEKTII